MNYFGGIFAQAPDKGIVHPKMMSLITHPHVVPSFILRTQRYFSLIFRYFGLIEVVPLLSMEGQRALGFHQKYLNLHSEDERRSYRFGTKWGWLINDRIFIFEWTIPLISDPGRNSVTNWYLDVPGGCSVLTKRVLGLNRLWIVAIHLIFNIIVCAAICNLNVQGFQCHLLHRK